MHRSSIAYALAGWFTAAASCLAGNTNNILITGYWPPTNEMLREFSPSPIQNSSGWVGRNWENRGYDVYAYFPEFPGGTTSNPKGNGDLEVDYQDTAADWARIIAEVKPVAIITFSRANTTRGWELEPAAQRFRLSGEASPAGRTVGLYTNDYLTPFTPSNVPSVSEPVGTIRNSSLPMQAIVDAVAAQMTPAQIDPFIQTYTSPTTYDFGGAFLSGYISYLGCWHHDLNESASAQWRCVASGHIHVGSSTLVANANQAAKISIRTLITHVNTFITPCPADFNDSGSVTVQDLLDFFTQWLSGSADINASGSTSVQDILDFVSLWLNAC